MKHFLFEEGAQRMGRQDSVTIASQHWGLFTAPAAASGFVSGVSALQRPGTGLEKKVEEATSMSTYQNLPYAEQVCRLRVLCLERG